MSSIELIAYYSILAMIVLPPFVLFALECRK